MKHENINASQTKQVLMDSHRLLGVQLICNHDLVPVLLSQQGQGPKQCLDTRRAWGISFQPEQIDDIKESAYIKVMKYQKSAAAQGSFTFGITAPSWRLFTSSVFPPSPW